jgi:peptide/nickel transport system ATP-binding protein/oligopeptide transport system ATP-binding protein
MPEPDASNVPLLEVENLHKDFAARGWRRQVRHAVDGVSFSVESGGCLAIVGESGSGKSTLARSLLRLVEPTSGTIRFKGRDLTRLPKAEMRRQRRHLQMIFQDPYASLHPLQTVQELISEPWKVHRDIVPRKQRSQRIGELLRQVGLPEAYASLYPSRLSGGERQRVAIARALAVQPELLVLDEPVSALDVSIQAQVINVLMNLHRNLRLAYVFISHDLALVRLVADRVAVMYMGRFVETGTVEDLFTNPTHPYTQALLSSSPSLTDPAEFDRRAEAEAEAGLAAEESAPRAGFTASQTSSPESPDRAERGCPYRSRCPKAEAICSIEAPALIAREPARSLSHLSACHFAAPPQAPAAAASESPAVASADLGKAG